MSGWMTRVYDASPVWVQQLGINAFGWWWARRRLGPEFERQTRAYVEREAWPVDHLREYVEKTLREQVQRAYREVPFYREAFRKYGVTEALLENFTPADLPKLPLLEKSTVRANAAQLLTVRAAKRPPHAFGTSGTTGAPIRVYWDAATHQHNMALREARSFRWAGVSIRESRAIFGARIVVPKLHSKPPFWRYNLWEKQLYLSHAHILRENVPAYVWALNHYRPVTLTGFPSANYYLARLIRELGLEVHSPRALVLTSEPLEPYQRVVLEAVYRARCFEEYGSVENCVVATECERGRLHVHSDFGYLEILRPDGTPAAPGEVGEFVVTGFSNTNQIFLRYRIGDFGKWATESCPCGRTALPVVGAIVGRQEDAIVLADGREIMGVEFMFKEERAIEEAQVIQEDYDRFVINVVPAAGYSAADRGAIRSDLIHRYEFGPDVKIEIYEVDFIPREPNGKFRHMICRVPRRPIERAAAPESQLTRS